MTVDQICKLPGAPAWLRDRIVLYKADWRYLEYPGINLIPDRYLINSQGRTINTKTWRISYKLTENMSVSVLYLNRFEQYKDIPRAAAVLHTFVGPPPRPEARILRQDYNRHNYNVSNLRWK